MLLRRLALTGAALTTLALAGCSTSDTTTASSPATTAPAATQTAASTAGAGASSSPVGSTSTTAGSTATSPTSATSTRSTSGTTTGGAASAPGTSPTTAPGSLGCSPLVVGEDGTISPLFCASDTVNPAAVAYYQGDNDRGLDPAVLRLPSSADRTTVVQTICSDLAPGSAMSEQTEQQAYELAAQRADWDYELNVVNLDC